MIKFNTFIILLLAVLFTSCETDSYDSGDGALSRVTTAFGETSFDSEGRAYKFVTDGDNVLNFTAAYGKPNDKLSGKVLRTLLYYYLTDDAHTVTPYAIINVLTTDVIDKEKVKQDDKDPLKVEAVWLSENHKYLNLSLKIKTSNPEDSDVHHKLGMVYDGSTGGKVSLHLLHDNGDIPGNYTASVYFSVRIASILDRDSSCDTINIEVMTQEGPETFEVKLK